MRFLKYIFDLDEDFFVIETDGEAVCGEYDNVCPDSCDSDDDQVCLALRY